MQDVARYVTNKSAILEDLNMFLNIPRSLSEISIHYK